jgi:hypothetical protein
MLGRFHPYLFGYRYFQVLPFGGGRLPQGTVAFHPAFDATE